MLEDIDAAKEIMLRTIVEDFEQAFDPEVAWDVNDIRGCYVEPSDPGPFMLVAEDGSTGGIIATCGVRAGKLTGGPEHLIERYKDNRTGQLVRVYVLREHRRRGIAAALVRETLTKASEDGHYDRIALHTYAHSPGALPFWESMGAEVIDERSSNDTRTVFMEFPSELAAETQG